MRFISRTGFGVATALVLAAGLATGGAGLSTVAYASSPAPTTPPSPAPATTQTPTSPAPTSPTPTTSPTPATSPTPTTGLNTDPSLAVMNQAGNHSMGSTIAQYDPSAVGSSSSSSSKAFSAAAGSFPAGVPGLDVSGWQTSINWSSVYANGGRFAYVKATENTNYVSSQFSSQYIGAYNAGLIRGAYHFAVPNASSGAAQAAFFVQNGGGWSGDGKTLPPLLDIEYDPYTATDHTNTCYGLSAAQMVQWIYDFSSTVLALTGRNPAIYSTTGWWTQCTGNSAGFSGNPLFIARYPNSLSEGAGALPASWSSYQIWQYADAGVFPGDQDTFNGTASDLQDFAFGSNRLAGEDEYGTSAALSATFAPGVSVAYIASGQGYADALSGAAAAGRGKGPVLLVAPTAIPPVITTELTRLQPKTIVVLGGSSAISDTVEQQLGAYTYPSTGKVSRLAGSDRYGTSAAVVKATFAPDPATLFIATGEDFPDALSGAALAAGGSGGPLLLVTQDSIPPVIATELAQLHPGRIVIMGGTVAVSANVEKQLQSYTTGVVSRLAGTDRYGTSAIAASTFPAGGGIAYVAVGTNYPDALSGAPVAGASSSPLLLVQPDSIPPTIAAQLTRLKPADIVILGGPAAVSTAVANELQTYTN